MRISVHPLLSAVLSLAILVPVNAHATNGYFLIGFGAHSRAMGGTGVAHNTGAMAAAVNPASLVDSGDQFDLGAEIFHPPRAIYHDSSFLGQTNERSNHDWFMIPSMGISWKWDDRITLGAAMFGAGLKTEYTQNSSSGTCQSVISNGGSCPPTVFNILNTLAAPEAGVELYQIQITPSASYKIDDKHAVGASIVIGAQYFRAEGLEDFGTAGFTSGSGSDGLTGKDFSHSFGLGYRLGYYGKFMDDDRLILGVNYSPRVDMYRFERYRNLFAEGGDFDIPEHFTVGFSFKIRPDVTVAFDYQKIYYSNIASVGNPGPDVNSPSSFFTLCPGADKSLCELGGPLGLGFGWNDQQIYKFGAEWRYDEKWTFRAGYNYGKAPIPADQVLFNMLAPATPEQHFTLGGEYTWSKDYLIAFNYMHAPLNTIRGPTVFGPTGSVVTGTNASIAMEQHSLGATLKIIF